MAAIESSPSRSPTPRRPRPSTGGLRPRRHVKVRESQEPTHRFPRVHAVARRLPAEHRRQPDPQRARGRRDDAEAGQEELLGLRRCRAGPGRDDLEGRDVVEEGHRPGHPRGRRGRAAARRRGRRRRASSSTSTTDWPWARASAASTSSSTPRRSASSSRSTRAGPPPRTPVSRPRAPVAPDRRPQRRRTVHRPGRVRLGGRLVLADDIA